VDLEYFRIEKKYSTSISLMDEEGKLKPIGDDVGKPPTEEPKDLLSHIIKVLNENYGGDLTEDDKVNLEKIQTRLHEDEELRKYHTGDNTESNKQFVFNQKFDTVLQGLVDDSLGFYKKITEPKRNDYVKRILYQNYSSKYPSMSDKL
jgi:type I restriction enzyme R subunit